MLISNSQHLVSALSSVLSTADKLVLIYALSVENVFLICLTELDSTQIWDTFAETLQNR